MELYADYLKEQKGVKIIELPEGFATYKIDGNTCYLQDIYVKPEFRIKGIASKLADRVTQFAKEAKCTRLLGSTEVGTAGDTVSLQAQLAYGFKLYMLSGSVIVTSKELQS